MKLRYYILALVILFLDQITKWIIVKRMDLYEAISVIGEFFEIYSHRNRGAAFGILQDQRWFFIVVTTIVLIGIIWYIQRVSKQQKILLPIALGVLLGGATGNFIDRLINGEVVDFFKFRFQFSFFGSPVDYTFPVFNVADIAIVVSVGLIFLDVLRTEQKEKRNLVEHDA